MFQNKCLSIHRPIGIASRGKNCDKIKKNTKAYCPMEMFGNNFKPSKSNAWNLEREILFY